MNGIGDQFCYCPIHCAHKKWTRHKERITLYLWQLINVPSFLHLIFSEIIIRIVSFFSSLYSNWQEFHVFFLFIFFCFLLSWTADSMMSTVFSVTGIELDNICFGSYWVVPYRFSFSIFRSLLFIALWIFWFLFGDCNVQNFFYKFWHFLQILTFSTNFDIFYKFRHFLQILKSRSKKSQLSLKNQESMKQKSLT